MAARVPHLCIRALIATVLTVAAPMAARAAESFTTSAPHALLLDYDSGSVLFERDADKPVPPASLTKMMTMAIVFQALKDGKISLDDEFVISENAWRRGGAPSHGSAMFAAVHSRVKLSDLLRGVIVQSGNDAAIAIAEGLMGNETAFAKLMTDRAKEIGLASATFRNAEGYPDPDQKISARDLARLATHIIRNFPEYYEIYGEREFTWNKIRQQNRNPLLAMNIGADGLKTGFLKEAGYNLVGSAVQGGQRLIVVVLGARTEKERAEEARKLLEWGFRNFESRPLFADKAIIGAARTFGGNRSRVDLVADGPVRLLIPRGTNEKLQARIVYRGPLRAPIAAGDVVARLRVMRGTTLALDLPLRAVEPVEVGSVPQRALDSAEELALQLFKAGVAQIKAKVMGQ